MKTYWCGCGPRNKRMTRTDWDVEIGVGLPMTRWLKKATPAPDWLFWSEEYISAFVLDYHKTQQIQHVWIMSTYYHISASVHFGSESCAWRFGCQSQKDKNAQPLKDWIMKTFLTTQHRKKVFTTHYEVQYLVYFRCWHLWQCFLCLETILFVVNQSLQYTAPDHIPTLHHPCTYKQITFDSLRNMQFIWTGPRAHALPVFNKFCGFTVFLPTCFPLFIFVCQAAGSPPLIFDHVTLHLT